MNIGGKQFMNLQEAVGWLLQNNALPFQCNVNYVGNTEIAKTSIINPSPAEIKVGALVLFADSKIGTVSGVSSNSFMVSTEYVDIQNALAYISSVNVNASGHLITTLSDGTVKDAGQIKMISSFSINGSQHLIANFNNGTTQDLGAIFSGNVNISGSLNATAITGDSIIENMSGYTYVDKQELSEKTIVYAGVVKNGNKLTFVLFGSFKYHAADGTAVTICQFGVPVDVRNRLYPYSQDGWTTILAQKSIPLMDTILTPTPVIFTTTRVAGVGTAVNLLGLNTYSLVENTEYYFRYEQTFLLSDNLAA